MSALFNLFYLYDPWFFHIIRMSFLVGFVALLWFSYQWFKKSQKHFVLPVDSLIATLTLIGLSIVPILINGTKELGVISMYVKLLISFVLGIFVYNLFYNQENGKANLVRDLKVGVGVQAFVGFAALAGFPFMIDFAVSTNSMMGGHLPRFIGSEQEYRLYNLTSVAFFPLSIFYSALLHFLLAYHHKSEALNPTWLFLLLCVGLIAGRTFLIFSVVSILLYFRLRYLPALIAFAVLLLYLAFFHAGNLFVQHALEPLINLFTSKEQLSSLSSSTDTLINHHLFMPGFKQFLMGDGMYYQPNGWSYYGGSDSGFIRQTLYGGVGYILVCFAFTAYFVKRIADNWFNGSWLFVLSTLGMMTVWNIKADTYAYPSAMFSLLMLLSMFGTSGRNLRIFNK